MRVEDGLDLVHRPNSMRQWLDAGVTTSGPKKRSPGQTNAQHEAPETDPNLRFIEAGSSGGLGWGTTSAGGYQPFLVRILRALARRRDQRRGS